MSKRRTSPIWLVSKEVFAEIVKNSNSISEVLRYFKFQNKGNNYKTVHKRIQEDGLDISHFNSDQIKLEKLKILNEKRKPDIKLLLIENSICNNSYLKKRLIEENVIDYHCSDCKNKGEWNGKKLVLQLEHINGKSNDNRIENLCFLCPNCHSQTDTYAGKGRKKTKKIFCCCECGKEGISKKAKLCLACSGKSRRIADRPDIETLIKDVSELGYSATGRKYGVSDNTIRKWIKN